MTLYRTDPERAPAEPLPEAELAALPAEPKGHYLVAARPAVMGKQGVRIVELQPAAWYAVQDKTVFPLESEDLLRLLDNKDVTLDVFDSAPLYARAMAAGGWGSSIVWDGKLAAYLLDASASKYNLSELIISYRADAAFTCEKWPDAGALADLFAKMKTEITALEEDSLYNDIEFPLAQVLADMTSDTGSPVATDRQEDYEPDWNYVGSDNAPKQRAIAQGTYGSYAKAAQKVGNALAKDRQTDRFDELNQWMDADPRHREVVNLLRQKEYTTQEDKGVAPEQAVQVTGTKQRYSPGDLLKMGYTAQEINEARAYIREYDALPVTDRAVRRTADTTKGIAATVASAVPMAGEMTAMGVKDIRATQKNEAALDKELEGDARGKELKDRITAVNMDYNPQYTDEDLRGMGYSQSEIDEMRSRIAGTVQKTALDKDTSLGYQLYHYGQQRTEAAQAGMSPAAKTAMGVATSAAENLAVAGVSPYLVLPGLTAQGAAESMGQDVEKGTSAGQAVGVGLAKFGAGWAINSVGVADMARSMGVDYARDTVAGKLADLVRSSKLVSGLGNSQLAAKKKTWIDFNAGVVADGERTLDEAGADLYQLVLDVASGKQTCAEKKGFREISIFKDGVVL